jgi:hypothetical protein
VESCDGREEQRGGQASVPEPLCLPGNNASCYEGVVSAEPRRKPRGSAGEALEARPIQQRETYSTREPGPYCPDTGQAQTTCKASLAASAAVAFRATRAGSAEAQCSAGMALGGCPQRGGRAWRARGDSVGHRVVLAWAGWGLWQGRGKSEEKAGEGGLCQ